MRYQWRIINQAAVECNRIKMNWRQHPVMTPQRRRSRSVSLAYAFHINMHAAGVFESCDQGRLKFITSHRPRLITKSPSQLIRRVFVQVSTPHTPNVCQTLRCVVISELERMRWNVTLSPLLRATHSTSSDQAAVVLCADKIASCLCAAEPFLSRASPSRLSTTTTLLY